MDLHYETALRNAVKAWSKNRMADPVTMQNLKRHSQYKCHETNNKPFNTIPPTNTELPQPALARYGNLGTRLNLFA